MKSIKLLMVLVFALLSLIVFAFTYHFFKQDAIIKETENLAFCGTVNDVYYLDENTKDQFLSGKELFKTYCAQCHHKNMKDDLTGPALAGSISRWNNDTIKILSYLNNPAKYISESKNVRIREMHEKYGNGEKPNYSFSAVEVKALIDYIELVN